MISQLLSVSHSSLFRLLLDFILSAGTIPKQTSKIICLLECTVKFTVFPLGGQLKPSFYRLAAFTY